MKQLTSFISEELNDEKPSFDKMLQSAIESGKTKVKDIKDYLKYRYPNADKATITNVVARMKEEIKRMKKYS